MYFCSLYCNGIFNSKIDSIDESHHSRLAQECFLDLLGRPYDLKGPYATLTEYLGSDIDGSGYIVRIRA